MKESVLEIRPSAETKALYKAGARALDLRRKIEELAEEEQAIRLQLASELEKFFDTGIDQYYEKVILPLDTHGSIALTRKGDPEITITKESKAQMKALFGNLRALLFPMRTRATVLDVDALVEEIRARGNDVQDYLDIEPRKGVEGAFHGMKSVDVTEVFETADDWFERLNDSSNRLGVQAKEFVRNFIADNFKTVLTIKT